MRDEGLIGGTGLTKFDAQHLHMLLKHGFHILSNQVCFSLLDRRAAEDLANVAEEHGVRLLGFGTLAGGFLGSRWQDVEEPGEIADWSRMKYKRFIDAAGG